MWQLAKSKHRLEYSGRRLDLSVIPEVDTGFGYHMSQMRNSEELETPDNEQDMSEASSVKRASKELSSTPVPPQ